MASSFTSRLGTAPEEAVKAPVVVVSTANLTLSGEQTVNSVAVVAGDRVCVAAQTDNTENAIYDVGTASWTRSKDFNNANDVINGVMVLDTNSGNLYRTVFTGVYTPDTTAVSFGVIIGPTGQAIITHVDLAAAVADPLLTDGTVINLVERTAGNGGGAFWDVVLSSTVTENTYEIVQCTGVATLSLVLRWDKCIVNAREWGALGDGSTDDTAALQNCLETCKMVLNSTSEVPSFYIPYGVYITTANLTFVTDLAEPASGRIHMYGDGMTQTQFSTSTDVTKCLEMSQAVNTVEWNYFHDFTINGNANTEYGIEGPNFSNSYIQRLHIFGCTTAAIDLAQCWNTRIMECWLGTSGIGINLRSGVNGFTIQNNIILSNTIGIKVVGSVGCNIISNDIESITDVGIYAVHSNRALRITGNYFEGAITGLAFTTDSITIKSQIILNGASTDTTLTGSNPNIGVDISGNYVINTSSAADSFIYTVGLQDASIYANFRHPDTSLPLLGFNWKEDYTNISGIDIGNHANFDAIFSSTFTNRAATTALQRIDGNEFDVSGVNKQNIAIQDFNQWTVVNSVPAGTFIRSATNFTEGGSQMPVWEVNHATLTTDTNGWTLDASLFPEYIGKFFYFSVYAKSDTTSGGPMVHCGLELKWQQAAGDTNWNRIGAIFKWPATGTLTFGVGKWGVTDTTCLFAAPVLAEMGAGGDHMFNTIQEILQFRGSAAPTAGTWKVADTVLDTIPTVGAGIGWVCITAGAPGTWHAYGHVMAESTTAALEDVAASINTDASKVKGYTVRNTTTGLVVVASDLNDNSTWVYLGNMAGSAHTPI